ncbi:MAG: alpha/beta hydrolase family protein, partial [Planctomycetia bacterium]
MLLRPSLFVVVLVLAAAMTTAGLAEDVRRGPPKGLDGFFPFEPPANAAAWPARREAVQRRVLVALGLWPLPTKTPLAPVIHGKMDRGDYTVEKVFFESLPGLFVTGNLYRPTRVTGKVPGVLFAHGHWADARLSDQPRSELLAEIASGAERFEQGGRSRFQSLCVQLARMGCVVWHWDMLGASDCRQLDGDLVHGFGKQRPEMSRPDGWGFYSPQAEARLQSIMGVQTWNSVRALDFLLSLPEVDPTRIAMTGASGGGTQTFMLAGIDDRVALSYPVVMVSTGMQGGCTCENASLLRLGTGNVEFTALFAPKPQGMNTADDWTKDLATKGFPELKRLYGLLGRETNVFLQRGEHFPHNYNAVSRTGFYTFLNEHFRLGHESPVIERDYEPLPRERLTVWDAAHPAPAFGDAAFEKRLVRWLAEDAAAQIGREAATAAGLARTIRPAVETLVGRTLADTGTVAWDAGEKVAADGHLRIEGILRNQQRREEVAVTWLHPEKRWQGDVVLWLDGTGRRGLEDADRRPTGPVRDLLAAGATVVGADLFRQADPAPVANRLVANPREVPAYTYCYNHTLFAQRVHDVLTILAFLRTGDAEGRKPKRIVLAAFGDAGPVAAAALAVAGDAVDRAAIDTGGFRFAALTDYRAARVLPGGAKYLDLPGMLALRAPRPLWLAGEGATAPAGRACPAGRGTSRRPGG